MISQDFILLILNCKKYRYKADLQKKLWVNNLPYFIKHFYIVGDENLNDEYLFVEDTLFVKCKDDYISLPIKIMCAIKAINKVYDYKYIFKTDDDQMLVNKSLFTDLCQELDTEKYDYGGFIVDVKDHYTEYKSNQINKKIKLNACKYANGRFYLLSKKSCEYLMSVAYKFYDYIYEDYSIGYELSFVKDLRIKTLETQFDDFMDIDIYINNKYHIYTETISSSLDRSIELIENYRKNNPEVALNVYITFSDSKYFESKLSKDIIDKVEFHAVSEKVKLNSKDKPNYALNAISASVINGCKNTDKNFILINTPKFSLKMIERIVIEMEKGFDIVCGKDYKDSFICASPNVFTEENIKNMRNEKEDIYDIIENVLCRSKNVKIVNYL